MDDISYLTSDEGIVRVPAERWRIAQAAECTLWMEGGLWWASDRNEEHEREFANYDSLRSLRFRRALEIGCGPFTNLRLIAKRCEILSVSLLDPLIGTYLHHPSCSYSRKYLFLQPIHPLSKASVILKKVMRVSPSVARGLHWLMQLQRSGERIPVERLYGEPAEVLECEPHDLVVMINVLEHCFDASQVFARVLRAIAPGGVFVFHDNYYTQEEAERAAAGPFDPFHPLRIEASVIQQFLETNFETLYFTEKTHQFVINGAEHSHEVVYYIGRRRG